MRWLVKIFRAVVAAVFGPDGTESRTVVFLCCAACEQRQQCQAVERCLGELMERAREADTPIDKPKPGVK